MAKSKKIQNSTILSIEQLNAIDLLITGQSDRVVGEKVGVSRGTVTKWRLENIYFQAELNRKRQNIWAGAENKLRALVADAVDVLAAELEEGSLKAAEMVLKAVNLYGNVHRPKGGTEPDAILVEQAESWADCEIAKNPGTEFLELQFEDAARKTKLVQVKLTELKANL